MTSWSLFIHNADRFRISMMDNYILNPANARLMEHNTPLWLSDQELSENSSNDRKKSVWKPILVTVAVGGTVYLLFSVRSK